MTSAEVDGLSLEAPTSVAGGVRTLGVGSAGGATASRLCSFEKVGYGKLDLDSERSGEGSSSTTVGIDGRRLDADGEREVLEEVFSLVEEVRWVEDL